MTAALTVFPSQCRSEAAGSGVGGGVGEEAGAGAGVAGGGERAEGGLEAEDGVVLVGGNGAEHGRHLGGIERVVDRAGRAPNSRGLGNPMIAALLTLFPIADRGSRGLPRR